MLFLGQSSPQNAVLRPKLTPKCCSYGQSSPKNAVLMAKAGPKMMFLWPKLTQKCCSYVLKQCFQHQATSTKKELGGPFSIIKWTSRDQFSIKIVTNLKKRDNIFKFYNILLRENQEKYIIRTNNLTPKCCSCGRSVYCSPRHQVGDSKY